MNILDDLQNRGLLYQVTEGLEERLRQPERLTVYAGFDPTADSLQIGNLVTVLLLRRFQEAGHVPIALVGGGTGLIGDPGGKSEERVLNPAETVAEWAEKIRAQLEPYLDFNSRTNPAVLVDNYEWLGKVGAIDLMRDVGKHFPVPYMLAKDSVASRLEVGISYTEFSYMVLQAFDFLQLNERFGCEAQLGGSDQWGEHHRRGRPDPALRRTQGLRPHLPLGHQGGRQQVRQKRGRHRVARRLPDLSLRILPVLDQRRRRQRPELPEDLHLSRTRRDRGARRGDRGEPGTAGSPAGARQGGDGAGARQGRGRQGGEDLHRPVLRRAGRARGGRDRAGVPRRPDLGDERAGAGGSSISWSPRGSRRPKGRPARTSAAAPSTSTASAAPSSTASCAPATACTASTSSCAAAGASTS